MPSSVRTRRVTGKILDVEYMRTYNQHFYPAGGPAMTMSPGTLRIRVLLATDSLAEEWFECDPAEAHILLGNLPSLSSGVTMTLEGDPPGSLYRIVTVQGLPEPQENALPAWADPASGGRSILLDYVHKEDKE